jgi:iron(III) transport system substrate-binding protein
MATRPSPAEAGTPAAARRVGSLTAALTLILAACAAPAASTAPRSVATAAAASASAAASSAAVSGTVHLYASVSQNTIDAVVAAYKAAHPDVTLDVFRAPTGDLAGRIAAEQRAGRIGGDVFWMTDPLSIQGYASQGLLEDWTPPQATGLDPGYIGDGYWGTRLLNMVMVKGTDQTPGPATWTDLLDPAYKDAVGIPDPGFAGSAFGALGYFTETPTFGIDFYQRLKANGAVQVKSPDDVTTGVAEGRFKAGMTLDNSARTAITKGSPVAMVWPTAGAIAIYSPIAVVKSTQNAPAAESFVDFVLSPEGQAAIGSTGWQPVRDGAGGPAPEGPQVKPDWAALFGKQDQLLTDYRAVFGG